MDKIKKYLLPSALILVLGLGLAVAQTITKALQLSQDASGAFGVDASNNVYFPGHVLSTGPGTPALTSCGTGPSITGTDTVGAVTSGTTMTGCIITFNKAYLAAPACVLSGIGGSQPSWTTSTTAITLAGMSSTPAYSFTYLCSGAK